MNAGKNIANVTKKLITFISLWLSRFIYISSTFFLRCLIIRSENVYKKLSPYIAIKKVKKLW